MSSWWLLAVPIAFAGLVWLWVEIEIWLARRRGGGGQ